MFDMSMYHGKKNVGSVKIRVDNLIKYWPEAERYKYGEKPDAMIFQKVYVTQDYRFPIYYPGIKILDICDPDWLEGVMIKETVDAVDAIVVPTQPLADFIKQLSDKPVRVIKDRFDLSEFPKPKKHTGPVKRVVWFGYAHNAELLKSALPLLEREEIELLVISDKDPMAWQWASHISSKAEAYRSKYIYKGYNPETIYKLIQQGDVCILPKGYRPQDVFKSENKTIIANLCGLPVATHDGELADLQDPVHRAEVAKRDYDKAVKDYDCRISVQEYKDLIGELTKA